VSATALRRKRTDLSRVALFACALLAACAAPRVKTVASDSAMLARQAAREQALAAKPNWQLEGRLGVATGKDSGSGSLQWKQDGDAFRFSVHAPVTGKTWTLTGDAHHATLEGLRDRPLEGDDAAALLERELGWHVPVAELSAWVRGARASGDARVEFREDGLPAAIVQDGWKIEYPDYDTTRMPPLPRKVFASRGEYRVRLAVSDWR
jgi:outer membrane lipoprotein LolB